MKDIANLKQKCCKESNKNDLDDVIGLLKRNKGATVELLIDDENNVKGLFYKDSYMTNVYSKFPELLLVDATYKLLDLRQPVYLLLTVTALASLVQFFHKFFSVLSSLRCEWDHHYLMKLAHKSAGHKNLNGVLRLYADYLTHSFNFVDKQFSLKDSLAQAIDTGNRTLQFSSSTGLSSCFFSL